MATKISNIKLLNLGKPISTALLNQNDSIASFATSGGGGLKLQCTAIATFFVCVTMRLLYYVIARSRECDFI